MPPSLSVALAAFAILVLSVSLKGWSSVTLMRRYGPESYVADKNARRLFFLGKATPIAACASIVVLAYCTGLVWIEIPAWLFFAAIVWGVALRIRRATAALSSRPTAPHRPA